MQHLSSGIEDSKDIFQNKGLEAVVSRICERMEMHPLMEHPFFRQSIFRTCRGLNEVRKSFLQKMKKVVESC